MAAYKREVNVYTCGSQQMLALTEIWMVLKGADRVTQLMFVWREIRPTETQHQQRKHHLLISFREMHLISLQLNGTAKANG